MPCTPNPTTGYFFYIPADQVIELPISADEAARRFVQAGGSLIVPPFDIDIGRCVVAHEAPVYAGLGAEIAARVTERCFYHLEAPVLRVGGFAIPYPPSRLEDHYSGGRHAARLLQVQKAAGGSSGDVLWSSSMDLQVKLVNEVRKILELPDLPEEEAEVPNG